MPRTVVILGMHRSGTSIATRMLHDAGLHLGDDLLQGSLSNLDGHWESVEAISIHDANLKLSNGAWNDVPDEVVADEPLRARMRGFLEKLWREPVSGWKDPRTVITFPVWRPLIDDCAVVACVRNPLAVARSLNVRDGLPIEDGLRLWRRYNQCLLRDARNLENVIWFDFDMGHELVAGWLADTCERLNLRAAAESSDLFDRFQRHHDAVETPDDAEVRGLYEMLLELAHKDDARWLGRSIAATTHENARTSDASDLTADAQRLGEVVGSRLDARLSSLARDVEQLGKSQARQNSLLQDFQLHCETRISQANAVVEAKLDANLGQQKLATAELRGAIEQRDADQARKRQSLEHAVAALGAAAERQATEIVGIRAELETALAEARSTKAELREHTVLFARFATALGAVCEPSHDGGFDFTTLAERISQIDDLRQGQIQAVEELHEINVMLTKLVTRGLSWKIHRFFERLSSFASRSVDVSPAPHFTQSPRNGKSGRSVSNARGSANARQSPTSPP